MASALASLTANYTDSEGEDDLETSGGLDPSMDLTRIAIAKEGRRSPNGDVDTPGSSGSSSGALRQGGSGSGTPTKKAKLVSYIDPDAGLSDEDRGPVPMDLESEEEDKENGDNSENGVEDKEDEKNTSHCMEELWEGGVQLPPEPRGECSRELQDKFEDLYLKKKEKGMDYNTIIQTKKAFRNPSIYSKLIDFCSIDELGTNFPPELYDGHLFGRESYYDELAKTQKEDMDRREAQDKKTAEARKKSGDNRLRDSTTNNPLHRKSKWDQQMPGTIPGKVIPAFGSLKRK